MKMKRKISCRESSRLNIIVDREGGHPVSEDIQDGCLMRIADALERLASGKAELETLRELEEVKKDRDYHSSRRREEIVAKERLYRRLSALKGVITKLKKRLGDRP
jgi:hypothetical protein